MTKVKSRVKIYDVLMCSGVFLVSLPLMQMIGIFALMTYGFLIWSIPSVVGGIIGAIVLPQTGRGASVTEFDGPILLFAVFASLQNAIVCLYYMNKKERLSKRARVAFCLYILVAFLSIIAVASFLVSVHGFSEMWASMIPAGFSLGR